MAKVEHLLRAGDKVTIVDRFGKRRTGRAVMRGPAGWVLNMGGRHGTPAIASDENIVGVVPKKGAKRGPLGEASLPGSPTYRLRLHTGPLQAARRSVARQLKRAKAGKVVSTGTEHVYVDVKGNSCEDAQMRLAKALQQKGLRRLATQAWATTCQRRK